MGASDAVFVVSTGGASLTRWKAGLPNGNPGKMAIGLDGSLYVADVSTIRHFTGDGVPLGAWGVRGIGGVWGPGVDAQGGSMLRPARPSRSSGTCRRGPLRSLRQIAGKLPARPADRWISAGSWRMSLGLSLDSRDWLRHVGFVMEGRGRVLN